MTPSEEHRRPATWAGGHAPVPGGAAPAIPTVKPENPWMVALWTLALLATLGGLIAALAADDAATVIIGSGVLGSGLLMVGLALVAGAINWQLRRR